MGSQRIYYTSLIFLVAFPTRGRAEQTGGSQSEGESRPSLSALRFKQFVSLKFLLGSAPRIQCNLRCPTLDKYPPALIQVTLHRRVQQRGFQDSGGGKTLRTWRRERACWSKVFQVSSEWICTTGSVHGEVVSAATFQEFSLFYQTLLVFSILTVIKQDQHWGFWSVL